MNRILAFLAVLGLAGCGGRPPVPAEFTVSGKPLAHWLTNLESGNDREREKAIEALSNVGAADPKVIPALAAALRDQSANVRGKAALALLKIGPDAGSTADALSITAENDADARVREYASKALAKVRGD